ncbi:MAG: adenylate kinase [Gemmatimonadetes bacterium]|nr:adenylate kinase [Gemmatimonadota bacterium]
MNVILMGPPGAGKGTQGALLAERRAMTRIVTGDLLREAVQRGTPLGQKARAYMDAGELVPDSLMLELLREVLTAPQDEGRPADFLFDGFPRTLPQAQALDALFREMGLTLDAVIVVDVPDDLLIRRLSGRRTCASCGAVHNVYFQPPRVPGHCDSCGGPLVERPDDAAPTVRRRLEVYRRDTEPLIQYYQRSGTPVRHLRGDRDVDQVYHAITRALEPWST